MTAPTTSMESVRDEDSDDSGDSKRSTETAVTGVSGSASICASSVVDFKLEPGPEAPWGVKAVDAEETDQLGVGVYGLLAGNWGHLKQKQLAGQRNKDLLCAKCHILVLQEADPAKKMA